MVEDCDLFWFEEPVSADDKAGHGGGAALLLVPISAGESEFTRHDFRESASFARPTCCSPTSRLRAGSRRELRISALASAFNLRLAPHLWSGAPAFAAGMHLAATQCAGFILEYSLGHNPMLHDLIEESFPVEDGFVAIPDRPGLGITVRETSSRNMGGRHEDRLDRGLPDQLPGAAAAAASRSASARRSSGTR